MVCALQYDVDTATEKMRDMLRWRVSASVDRIRQHVVEEGLTPDTMPHAEEVLKHAPTLFYFGTDRVRVRALALVAASPA